MPLDSGTLLGHYKILAAIGAGGMGEVYRATDTKLGRDVAIKIIPEALAADPDRMARFTREAQVLASLNHPNIAAIYGVEERALILEMVEGATLEGPMTVAEVLPVARQIVEALAYAHEKGVIHRDLKPANIKLTPEGRVKVLDFGLAKALSSEGTSADPTSSPTLTMRATMAGVIMGTAAYMSPEQARGAPTDKRADIWSFGVVLYELLTGRQIFGGDTVSDSLAAVLKTDPDWSALPPDTPPAMRRLLRRCLERDRKKRLSDIGDARLEIDEALAAPAESPAPPAAAVGRGSRANRWGNVALALVALAGVAVAVVHWRETPPEVFPVRFQVPAPPNANFGNFGMAISPDGRRLAFIAIGPEGKAMVWVRPLDSVTAQPLPGTEGATFLPFWSPDSRYLGFMVQTTLKKIEAGAPYGSGPPQTLCEAPPGVLIGGTWSRDGVILFSTNAGGLWRVPQAGGVPTQVTKSDLSQGELGHLRPWFLPDGRHFLYVTRSQKPDDATIYVASLDGKERKRLVASRQAGAYAPPAPGAQFGHLLFMRDSTLMAQPLDTAKLELTGEAFPLAERIGSSLAMAFFSVSANGVLISRSGSSAGNSRLLWFDRQGKSLGTLGPTASYSGSMALSPDGKRLAVDIRDSTGNLDVWVIDVARDVPTRFTFDRAVDSTPIWSPDGNRLFFGSMRSGQGVPTMYHKDSSGVGNEEPLLPGWPGDWSPDGRHLLYVTLGGSTGLDLWLAPVSGDQKPIPYLQTSFDERHGKFSPDGHWIAYTSDESGNRAQIFVQSFPLGAGKYQVSTSGGIQPRWRRDGKELFYIAADGKLTAVDVKTSPKFEAGTPRELFDPHILDVTSQRLAFQYDVSADGKRFLVNSTATDSASPAPEPINVVLNWQAAQKH